MPSAPLKVTGLFDATITAAPRSRERVENLPVDLIDNHPRNTTTVTKEMLDEAFLKSIEAVGVLQPVLVVPREDGRYYLLAGHKRLLASKLCAREFVPAILRKDLPPGLEDLYITDTNLQYGIKNMLPSEKARTLYAQYEGAREFRKYCRLHAGEKSELELGGKVIKFEHLEKTREALAAAYGLTAAEVQRYLSLHTLQPALFTYLDSKKLAVAAACSLAKLPENWQEEAARCMQLCGRGISARQAEEILVLHESGGDIGQIAEIMQREPKKEAPKQTKSYRLPPKILNQYFAGMPKDDIEKVLDTALQYYFLHCKLKESRN